MALLTDIFCYLDVADWLSAEYAARVEADPSLTHRRFSALCGYRSSGAISLISSGRRRMSRRAADRVAGALGLDPPERDHLRRMVEFSHAESFDERARLVERMQAARRFAEQWRGTIDAYSFYREWTLPVVRELVSLPDFEEDPAWIVSRLHPRITVRQAAEALEELQRLGHLQRAADGRLHIATPIVATPSEVRSDALKNFQRKMMTLAGEALDTQGPDRRDMRVVTMAISEGQAARIKALLIQLHKEVLAAVEEDEPIETVVQLNTQLFALTDPPAAPGEPGPGGDR